MPGGEAIRGFGYQIDFLIYRLFTVMANRILTLEDDTLPRNLGVESVESESGTAWDVTFESSEGIVELVECKDTAIGAVDRRRFYERLRKTLANSDTPEKFRAGWAFDPDKQSGNIERYFTEMRSLAALFPVDLIPCDLPRQVEDAQSALNEALYILVRDSRETVLGPSIDPRVALDILAELVVEPWRGPALGQRVDDLAARVFASESGSAFRSHVKGEIVSRIQNADSFKMDLTELSEDGGLISSSLMTQVGLRSLMRYCRPSQAREGIVWKHQNREDSIALFSIFERCPTLDLRESVVVVGTAGIGKSTICRLAYEQQQQRLGSNHSLFVDVRKVDESDIELLPDLCSILCGIGETSLAIDGLDRIREDVEEKWERTLGHLLGVPRLKLLVTVRTEVIESRQWLSSALERIHTETLPPLTPTQVSAAFEDGNAILPENQTLRDSLRNPFVLSLYAGMADKSALDGLAYATLYAVIDQFWKLRVTSNSEGQRLVGSAEQSEARKAAAISFLQEKTLEGDDVYTCDASDQDLLMGLRMLQNEGILVTKTTFSFVWRHDLFMEYALALAVVDRVGRQGHLSAETLATEVSECATLRVRRLSGSSVFQWLCAQIDSRVSSEDFLNALYGVDASIAREAISTMLENHYLGCELSRLTPNIQVEAIQLAAAYSLARWKEKIFAVDPAGFPFEIKSSFARAVTDYGDAISK